MHISLFGNVHIMHLFWAVSKAVGLQHPDPQFCLNN